VKATKEDESYDMASENYSDNSMEKPAKNKKAPNADDWEQAVDSEDESKPKKKPKKERVKKQPKETVFIKEGQVKAANKLIGVVDDQDPDTDRVDSDMEGKKEEVKLDLDQLDFSRPDGEVKKKDIGTFLNKVQQKAQETEKDDALRMGAVMSLNRRLNKNELAAKGIQISIMDKLKLQKKAPKTVEIEINKKALEDGVQKEGE